LKQSIFIDAPRVGWMFERKEHLAVGAVAFAVAGCVAHLTLPWMDAATAPTVARVSHRCFVAAFLLAAVVACIGVAVASFRSF